MGHTVIIYQWSDNSMHEYVSKATCGKLGVDFQMYFEVFVRTKIVLYIQFWLLRRSLNVWKVGDLNETKFKPMKVRDHNGIGLKV